MFVLENLRQDQNLTGRYQYKLALQFRKMILDYLPDFLCINSKVVVCNDIPKALSLHPRDVHKFFLQIIR